MKVVYTVDEVAEKIYIFIAITAAEVLLVMEMADNSIVMEKVAIQIVTEEAVDYIVEAV